MFFSTLKQQSLFVN